MTRRRTKLSKTHYKRRAWREAERKSYENDGIGYSNTEGENGFGDRARGVYYRATAYPQELGAVCEIEICTRVYTPLRFAGLLIGGSARDAAATAVWLGTNKRP